jgi:uncharacterized protein YjbI with pentapeptide repeats
MPEKEPPTKKPADERSKEQLLRDRWKGQQERIRKIIDSAREKEYQDWTAHLDDLPSVHEIPSVFNEKCGRDLRGADLSSINLANVDFRLTDLCAADLSNAELGDANFSGANLTKATFYKSKSAGALFMGADITGTNFINADLKGAILDYVTLREDEEEAVLSKADLEKALVRDATLVNADLREANFRSANLERTTMRGAVLQGTILRDANLADSDLTETTGFLSEQLADSNVCNAKLPEEIQKFDVLEHLDEASKNARKIFLTMLLGSVYSWLTIATTTDPRLLTNSASSPLPVIGAAIPIVGFYFAAPLLLFGFYVYFHIYMQRLWEGLADLPARFPDGRPLDKTIYPWVLTGLVRAHFKRLRENRPAFSRLQEVVSIFLAWWVVPLTMLFFWWRYAYRHDWLWTCLHILLLGLSISLGRIFYRLAIRTLNGEQLRTPNRETTPLAGLVSAGESTLKRTVMNIPRWFGDLFEELQYILKISRHTLVRRVEIFTAVMLLFSYSAIWGAPFLGSWARANLKEADVSTKPENWTGKETSLVKGATLKEANLRNCMADSAFLVNADLQGADLRRGRLVLANLESANLTYADLRSANLGLANLKSARFQGADLRGAKLMAADLRNADFRAVKLEGADLKGADLGHDSCTEGRKILVGRELHEDTQCISEEQLRGVTINSRTVLPKHRKHLKEELLEAQKKRRSSEAKGKQKAQEQKKAP